MMAHKGPNTHPRDRCTQFPALNPSEGHPNRTFQYKTTPKGALIFGALPSPW
jgi:hypothetical protein